MALIKLSWESIAPVTQMSRVWILSKAWKVFQVLIFPSIVVRLHSHLSSCLTGVSIKFEVGSWLGKNNRLYKQGSTRPLNLGGSGGKLPQKILKSGSSEMPFPAFWAPNRVQKIKEDFLSTATFFFIFTTLISWKWQLVCIVTKNFLSICLFSFPTNSFINSSREKTYSETDKIN